jgi:hypothetical protein
MCSWCISELQLSLNSEEEGDVQLSSLFCNINTSESLKFCILNCVQVKNVKDVEVLRPMQLSELLLDQNPLYQFYSDEYPYIR